jgi:fructose-specific component phosphotransferase system IIB-like protein
VVCLESSSWDIDAVTATGDPVSEDSSLVAAMCYVNSVEDASRRVRQRLAIVVMASTEPITASDSAVETSAHAASAH